MSLEYVCTQLQNALSPDSSVRQPAEQNLDQLLRSSPDAFVKGMISLLTFTQNVDVCLLSVNFLFHLF